MTTTAATTHASTSLSPSAKWTLTQIHASAFVVAWFICVLSSIIIARYMRRPQNNIVSAGFWFQTHRILNFLAIGLMILGLVTILIAHQWSWLGPKVGGDRNGSSVAWHTILGVLSIGLAFVQPLNSFIRCDPSHKNRWIFNVAHRASGLISLLLAAICIAIACKYFGKRFTNPDAAFSLCLTIIIGTVLFVVYMEILSRRQEIRVGKFVTSAGNVTIQVKNSRISLSFASIIVFIVVLLIFAGALCLMIWLKKMV